MDPFFTALGRQVLAEWKRQNFSQAAFPEIARSALVAADPSRHVTRAALVQEFLLNDEQPLQTQSGFGQPELVVFEDPRFYIQVLFWMEGTTDIHQHTFSGAFHVMEGSSLHAEFEFQRAEAVTAHLEVGELRLKATHLLQTGSTVPIVAGRSQIHALFHLDTPSLTVVVRTQTDPGTGPQFTYLPPHLAVDPFHDDALTTRRKQLLDVLEQTEDADYAPLARRMIGELDFERGFFILQNCLGGLRQLGEWEETWAVFQQRHGALARYVAPTLDEIVRRDRLVAMRRAITEVEHRFFLALLLNVPTRAELLPLVAQRFDGAPRETVLRWVEELCAGGEFEPELLASVFPTEWQVPPADDAATLLEEIGARLR